MVRAFTLIELLVVITIIVVLLALLTPALDKAIYQAELAVCGANVRGIASGAAQYAMDHKRCYPKRESTDPPASTTVVLPLSPSPVVIKLGGYDDRLKLKGYMSLNGQLNCPLTGKVDIEGSKSTSVIYASYALWFGWQYTSGTNQGMFKLGDRMSWNDGFTGRRNLFTVLATDHDFPYEGDRVWKGTHPDADRDAHNEVMQDQNFYTSGRDIELQLGTAGDTELTASRWVSVPHTRGTVDTNHAFQDLSVERYNGVHWNEPDLSERMVRVPFSKPNGNPAPGGLWINLPPK